MTSQVSSSRFKRVLAKHAGVCLEELQLERLVEVATLVCFPVSRHIAMAAETDRQCQALQHRDPRVA